MENQTKFRLNPKLKLMDQVKEVLLVLSLCLPDRADLLQMDTSLHPFLRGKDPSEETEW